MFGLLRLHIKLLFLSFRRSRWLPWLLELAFVIALAGLIAVVIRRADPLSPFGIGWLDRTFLVALGLLFFAFLVVVVSVIGLPFLRYGGALFMLLGIGLFAYQVYEFWKLDEWPSFRLRDLTDALFLTWGLDKPTGWLKTMLAAILNRTPLSLVFFLGGGIWHIVAKKLLDNALQNFEDYERKVLGPFTSASPSPVASRKRWPFRPWRSRKSLQ